MIVHTHIPRHIVHQAKRKCHECGVYVAYFDTAPRPTILDPIDSVLVTLARCGSLKNDFFYCKKCDPSEPEYPEYPCPHDTEGTHFAGCGCDFY